MARRRRKNKDINSFRTFAPFIIAAGCIWLLSNNPQLFWSFAIPVILTAAVFLYYKFKSVRHRREMALKLRDLKTLSPRQLEFHVATVIASLPGWKAEPTRNGSDQGADVIGISPSGIRIAIQVKHYGNPVGNKAVQEIVASKAYYHVQHAIVVTSGPGYTRSALELAAANNVRLWQSSDLFTLQVLAEQKRLPNADLLPS